MSRPSAVAERRREILEATCQVVSERGFRDLRIVDVAKIAGYSTGTVHYYFDSKEKLLEEAFRFQYEESVVRREGFLSEGDSPVERLRKLADSYLPNSAISIRSWRVWLELWVSALGNSSLSAINDRYYGEWRSAVLAAANDGIREGLVTIPDPVAFTDAYVAMLDGLAIQVLIHAEHMTAERMHDTCERFIDIFVTKES